jgi:hypothetical protein
MITLLLHLLRLLPFLCGGHRQLALENLALRHQLAVYKRTVTRPKLRSSDRLFWVALSRVWAGWRQALAIAAPDTVLRWQRRCFRRHWTALSSRRQSPLGRPQNPWRTSKAGDRCRRAHRLPADPQTALTTFPDLANVAHQPCPRPRFDRLLYRAHRSLARPLRPGRPRPPSPTRPVLGGVILAAVLTNTL